MLQNQTRTKVAVPGSALEQAGLPADARVRQQHSHLRRQITVLLTAACRRRGQARHPETEGPYPSLRSPARQLLAEQGQGNLRGLVALECVVSGGPYAEVQVLQLDCELVQLLSEKQQGLQGVERRSDVLASCTHAGRICNR